MNLRNWELFTITGAPVVGASVEVREATLTHPNTGTILASTVTNVDGMFEFVGLPEGPKDVKITYQGKIKWLKGMTRHSVSLVVGENFVPANVNLLKNGGFELWRLLSYQIKTVETPIALAWNAVIAPGDVATVQRESTTIASSKSQFSARATYVKSSGPLWIYQNLPRSLAVALRGQTITLVASCRRGVVGSTQAFITDQNTDVLGVADPMVNSFGELTVTDTIGSATSIVSVGVKINASDDVYVDNVALTIGSQPGQYQARVAGSDVDQVDYAMLDRVFARSFLMGAG